MLIDPVTQWISALIPAGTLGVTAWSKIGEPRDFSTIVANYAIVPAVLTIPVAYSLPYVELVTALGLAVPPWQRVSALTALGLLGLFTSALAINLLRGRHSLDCGCHFGKSRTPLSSALLVRNAMLMACALPCAIADVTPRPLGGIDELTIAAASVVGVLAYGMAGSLLSLRPAVSTP